MCLQIKREKIRKLLLLSINKNNQLFYAWKVHFANFPRFVLHLQAIIWFPDSTISLSSQDSMPCNHELFATESADICRIMKG